MSSEMQTAPEEPRRKNIRDGRMHESLPAFAHAIIQAAEPTHLRHDLVEALRAMSSVAGFCARCPKAHCRKTGACKADEISEDGSPCLMFWTAPQRICFNAAIAAVTRSHIRTRQHVDGVRAMLDQWYADNFADRE